MSAVSHASRLAASCRRSNSAPSAWARRRLGVMTVICAACPAARRAKRSSLASSGSAAGIAADDRSRAAAAAGGSAAPIARSSWPAPAVAPARRGTIRREGSRESRRSPQPGPRATIAVPFVVLPASRCGEYAGGGGSGGEPLDDLVLLQRRGELLLHRLAQARPLAHPHAPP